MVTALISVAQRVGANRIVKAGGRFHHPFGDPTRTPSGEREWRRRMVKAALLALKVPVEGPTVFEPDELLQGAPKNGSR